VRLKRLAELVKRLNLGLPSRQTINRTGRTHSERRGAHLNPDEYLNQDVKRHIRALHERPNSKPGLKDTLTAFLRGRADQPEIVRRYFQASHLQYAA